MAYRGISIRKEQAGRMKGKYKASKGKRTFGYFATQSAAKEAIDRRMGYSDNPGEIHVDINSHNFADNPAAVVDAVNRLSQRPHKTKSGAVTKKPDARLKARRARNTKKGFYPNPADTKSEQYLRVKTLIEQSLLRVKKTPGKTLMKQAAVSYAQGVIESAWRGEIITGGEYHAYFAKLQELGL